ncbi:transposase [Bradyrhizobium sp. DASA03005]|uniref:transposase n=1 Tax=Bradyrhizobium sp. SPXBL-02 TaxID=3395912 RepID=UPI003F6FFA3A
MQTLQAFKGVGPVVAATVLAEAGDVAYFRLAPGKHSSGSTVKAPWHHHGGQFDCAGRAV